MNPRSLWGVIEMVKDKEVNICNIMWTVLRIDSRPHPCQFIGGLGRPYDHKLFDARMYNI